MVPISNRTTLDAPRPNIYAEKNSAIPPLVRLYPHLTSCNTEGSLGAHAPVILRPMNTQESRALQSSLPQSTTGQDKTSSMGRRQNNIPGTRYSISSCLGYSCSHPVRVLLAQNYTTITGGNSK